MSTFEIIILVVFAILMIAFLVHVITPDTEEKLPQKSFTRNQLIAAVHAYNRQALEEPEGFKNISAEDQVDYLIVLIKHRNLLVRDPQVVTA